MQQTPVVFRTRGEARSGDQAAQMNPKSGDARGNALNDFLILDYVQRVLDSSRFVRA